MQHNYTYYQEDRLGIPNDMHPAIPEKHYGVYRKRFYGCIKLDAAISFMRKTTARLRVMLIKVESLFQ